jgi:iron only hydrogenase large subunit-like protein
LVDAVVTGASLPKLEFAEVRGLAGIKEASVGLGDLGEVRVAAAHGRGNARKIMEMIVGGSCPYHFIEIMTCPGGGGGGQPLPASDKKRRLRAQALYRDDKDVQEIRQSHENPSIQALYREFLIEPLGAKSHALLHTHYEPR